MRRIRFRRAAISDGVAALSNHLAERGLNSKLIRLENTRFRQRDEDIIINWGTTDGADGLNSYPSVQLACNKLSCLTRLERYEINIPDYTDSIAQATSWVEEGSKVVCRTLLRGSAGHGIVIASEADELVNAPLYTRYVKKRDEYRVHVFNGAVIDMQRKARNTSVDDASVDWQIRTHDNGFVFVRENVELPQHAKDMCVQAVNVLGLGFGAVDIVHNEHYDAYYVLEINTAPGLEGQTIVSYADAIHRMAGEQV